MEDQLGVVVPILHYWMPQGTDVGMSWMEVKVMVPHDEDGAFDGSYTGLMELNEGGAKYKFNLDALGLQRQRGLGVILDPISLSPLIMFK